MPSYVTNKEIADILFNVAELLEIDEANRFRVNAYQNAAVSILNSREAFALKVERGDDLTALPNIGRDISEKIKEILRTGELKMLEELEHTMPPELVELSHVPGIGAKRVKVIEDSLGPLSPDILREAAKRGKLASLPGIGSKIQEAILTHFSSERN